jgi:hypothetical protein
VTGLVPGVVTAEVHVRRRLTSKWSAFLTAFVAAVFGAVVGVIGKGLADYFTPPKERVGTASTTSPQASARAAGEVPRDGGRAGSSAATPATSLPPASPVIYPGKWSALNGSMDWRVKSVDHMADRTRLIISVRNNSPMSPRAFAGFKRNPLSIVDNNGAYYEMISTSDPPGGVVVEYGSVWKIQGNRTIELVADFAPLKKDVTRALVMYKFANRAEALIISGTP